MNLGWWRDDVLSDYTHWLDALQANGANAARIWMASWSFGIEWSDTGLGNYDNRQLRAHWLDEVLKMAEQRGIYLVIGLIPDREFRADGLWAGNPYNAANGGMLQMPVDFAIDAGAKAMFKRRLRYIAARWGYSPNILAWEWWNEVESTRIETPALKPWIEDMTHTLRQFDINRHLVTLSYVGNGDDDVWRMPEIDLMQRHEYSESPKWFQPIAGGFPAHAQCAGQAAAVWRIRLFIARRAAERCNERWHSPAYRVVGQRVQRLCFHSHVLVVGRLHRCRQPVAALQGHFHISG